MKTRFWILVLVIVALLVLVGCSSRSNDNTDKSQENNQVTKSEAKVVVKEEKAETVEVEADKKKETAQREKEFNKAREELIEAGIIDHDTPTYMLGDLVPLINLDREYRLGSVSFWKKDKQLTIHFDIFGEERVRFIKARMIIEDKDWRIQEASLGGPVDGSYTRHNFKGGERPEVENLEYFVILFSVKENNDAFIVLQRDIKIFDFR